MADANTPSEGSFVFDSTRLDTPLYLDIIVAPDRTFVAFRIRKRVRTTKSGREHTNECA